MNRYSFLPFLFAICLLGGLWSTAHANFYLGFPVASQITESSVNSYLGVSLGTYNLGGGFGLRGNLEFKPILTTPYYRAGADLLYTTGESAVFYFGAGGGYSSAGGAESLYVAGTAGVDLDADSLISVFAEVQPRYDLTTEAGLLFFRAGVNVHVGK